MHGRRRSHGWLMHLTAGAALGAVVVLVVWIFSGGRPFGEVVGTSDVRAPTPAATDAVDAGARAETPAERVSRLASKPPAMGSASKELEFRRPNGKRPAKGRRAPKAKTPRRGAARRRPVVRVTAPPAEPAAEQELPVAAVPSPTATAAPPPPPAGGTDKPAKRRAPAYVIGAGEG